MIGLVDDNDLELLLGRLVDLLGLGDLFEQVLDDNSIIVPDIRRCYLKMVNGGYDVEFQLAIASRLENSSIDLDLLNAGAV